MARIEKSIFLSYRRKDQYSALSVYQYLTQRNYNVFLDYTSIPSGDFEQIIVSNIKARAHFIVILTPTALDRCNEPGDWLRREIETAINEKRNIVPLLFDGFRFDDPSVSKNLTGVLATLQQYNGLFIPTGYFEAAMERLCRQFLNIALDAVLHPIPDDVQEVVIQQQVAANKAMPEILELGKNLYSENNAKEPTAAEQINKNQNDYVYTIPEPFEKKAIVFRNGQLAEILHIREALDAGEILDALSVPRSPAAIIVGGNSKPFKSHLKDRLFDLLSRGLVEAALEREAVIIDEGVKTGIGEIVGQAVADRGRRTKLIGILPLESRIEEFATKVAIKLDINHTHFVHNEQAIPTWQAETMCSLAATVSQNKDWIFTILIGGELEGTPLELALETVRRGWWLVVIEGSGALADEIVKARKEIGADTVWSRISPFGWSNRLRRIRKMNRLRRIRKANPRLYEIISDGKIIILGPDVDAIKLRNQIRTITQSKEKILWTAWQLFAEYDANSIRHRNLWHRLRKTPLYLTLLTILLVLIHSTTGLNPQALSEGNGIPVWSNVYGSLMGGLGNFIRTRSLLDLIFRVVIISLPIVVSILLSVETRLKLGSKYLVLRGAAEAVKRGIYSFRVLKDRVSDKDNPAGLPPHDEKGLATHLRSVSKVLTSSDVNEAAFVPYEGPIPPNMFGTEEYDDGFSPLDPEMYVRVRIGDQLKFYTLRTNQYEKQIRRLQYLMLIFGAVGTFLAAVGMQYWIPLTAAIILAGTAYREYQQLEQRLTKYNLIKSNLETIQANWLSLSEAERAQAKNVQDLVRDVEATLESENQGWV